MWRLLQCEFCKLMALIEPGTFPLRERESDELPHSSGEFSAVFPPLCWVRAQSQLPAIDVRV